MQKNEKKTELWAGQGFNVDRPNDERSKGRDCRISPISEPECSRFVGRAGNGKNISFRAALTGGIISQLKEVVAEQLAEADEYIEWHQKCIDRYQRKSEQLRARSAALDKLQELNDLSPPESDN